MNSDTRFQKLAESQRRFFSKHLKVTAPLKCLEPDEKKDHGPANRYGYAGRLQGQIKPLSDKQEVMLWRDVTEGIDCFGGFGVDKLGKFNYRRDK